MDNRRPHTGRRRNEAARQSILDAAADLLSRSDFGAVTINTIAAAAGVGRQTIYRWWSSKGAVLLEAMVGRAERAVPVPTAGSRLEELESFLASTFATASEPSTATLLRTGMAEALRDPEAASVLREFAAHRRAILIDMLARAQAEGELPQGVDLALLADQAYGVLWYRLLLAESGPSADVGRALASALIRQASCGSAPGLAWRIADEAPTPTEPQPGIRNSGRGRPGSLPA
jgi:AcrR family transcriptional regulator